MSRAALLLPFLAAATPAMCAQAVPAAAPAWQAAIDARRAELISANGPGTDGALRAELLSLRDDDQIARGLASNNAAAATGGLRVASNLHDIDSSITARLKTVVQQHGWPTIALVGMEASNGAMLLLNHSTDPAWRASLLPQLETLADQRRIDGSQLALVVDKQLIASGKPQRYGTQFKLVDGEMAMYAVEDPGGLDTLRARTMLPPLDVYKAQLARMYHLRANNKIISPPVPEPAPAP